MIPWVCTAVEKSSLPFRRHGHRFQPSVLACDNNVTLCQLCAADATAAPKLWGWSWRPLCCTSWLMPLTSTISILGARRGHWHSGHQHWLWQRCQQPTTCTSVEFFRTLKSARFRDIKDCWLCATHSGPFYHFTLSHRHFIHLPLPWPFPIPTEEVGASKPIELLREQKTLWAFALHYALDKDFLRLVPATPLPVDTGSGAVRSWAPIHSIYVHSNSNFPAEPFDSLNLCFQLFTTILVIEGVACSPLSCHVERRFHHSGHQLHQGLIHTCVWWEP